MKEMTIEEKAKAYDEALRYAMIYYKEGNEDMKMMMKTCFPALVEESEDEKIRKAIIEYLRQRLDRSPSIPAAIGSWIAWLEKQDKSSDQIHYWTEEEIEPIISDYLRGAEHYGGMIGRLRCLKPKSLEKQGTPYTKSDVDDAYLKGISDAKNELEKQGGEKPNEGMIEALRTEYEKGRADVIADTLSWLANCWPQYCDNPNIIDGFKEAIKYD